MVQHVLVVLPRDLGLDLHHLALILRLADGASVGPATLAPTLPQAGLDPAVSGLGNGGNGTQILKELLVLECVVRYRTDV